MLQVDQIDTSGNVSSRGGYRMDGNLLHFAVVKNLKEHVRILLEHGLVYIHGRTELRMRWAVDLISNLY